MTTKNMLVLAALVCGSATPAFATDIYLTGSSAFRTNVMTYLAGKFNNKHAICDSGKTILSANYSVVSGNFGSPTGSLLTIHCAWTGSVGGIQTVLGSENVAFAEK